MALRSCFACLLALALGWAGATAHAADPKKTYATAAAAKADPDYAFQGEYVGTIDIGDGPVPFGVQVVAQGEGKFATVAFFGGLPGDGAKLDNPIRGTGKRKGDTVHITGDEATATIKDGVLTVYAGGTEQVFGKAEKTYRQSPTLEKPAPEAAVVLFDGSSADAFKGGRLTEDGLLMEGVTSKQTFDDFTMHIEFRLPYMPNARGQARGNSGFYAQGRYEVQMLDSFGLEGKNNECGGIYTVKAPDVNMCFPPLAWQTYDIDFTAAKYDDSGKKTADATMTVRHNGVLVHKEVPVPYATRAAPVKEGPEPGPVYLQNHGNPVRYRNIWVLPKGK